MNVTPPCTSVGMLHQPSLNRREAMAHVQRQLEHPISSVQRRKDVAGRFLSGVSTLTINLTHNTNANLDLNTKSNPNLNPNSNP